MDWTTGLTDFHLKHTGIFLMAVHNQWTGLVDWTTGLTDFHLKHTGMLFDGT